MRTPILETERLILKPMTAADAQAVFDSWTHDPEVNKFMMWELHKDVSVTEAWLKSEEANIDSDDVYNWGFFMKDTGEVFGSGGVHMNKGQGCFELGYNLARKYWNMGYATEASRRIVRFAKEDLGLTRLFCRHAVENIGSRRVIEKLGFAYTGDGAYESFSGERKYTSRDYSLEL